MTATELADVVVQQIRELAVVKGARDAYRLVAVEAVARLHQVARERDCYRERLYRLLDERRKAA